MKLYVGNLPFSITGTGLRDLFEQKGFEVTEAFVVEDKMTGRSRGFGFVETPQGAEAIAAFSGASISGRNIVVNEARPSTGGPRNGDRRGGSRGRDRY